MLIPRHLNDLAVFSMVTFLVAMITGDGSANKDMKPIDVKCIAKAINFIDSLQHEQKIQYSENIHELQPHAFLTIIAMSQDGVSMPKLDHAIHMLTVIHNAFYSDCEHLPIITRDMLQEAFEEHAAMLKSFEQGLVTHDDTLEMYPEKLMLAYIIGYAKDHNLISESDEDQRLMINIKTVLDAYIKAKSAAKQGIQH